MDPLKKIYEFIVNTYFESLPEQSVETAKLAYQDMLAVTVAGVDTPDIKTLLEEVNPDNQYKTVLGQLEDLNAREFALIFGTLSHVLDYDDVNFTFHGHPSVALIPAILTYAKYKKKLTGEELITSYIIGFEVQARIGEDIGDKQYNRGLHVTSTLGIFGAAASLTKLMDLTYEQFAQLIGMCTSFSSGTRKNFGTMTKPLHVGIMMENVYLFSGLAKKSFTGNAASFNSPMSFQEITTGEHSEMESLDKLGNTWESAEFGIIVKLYPCCAYTHRSMDGVIKLKLENGIKFEDIIHIEAVVNPKVKKVLIYPEAKTGSEGKFSMQYCLSAAFLDENIDLSTFNDNMVNREKHQNLMKKVSMVADENQKGQNKELYAEIKVTTLNGTFKTKVEFPLGHPKNPLSEQLMLGKVKDCIGSLITKEKIDKLNRVCKRLPEFTSTDLLSIFEER